MNGVIQIINTILPVAIMLSLGMVCRNLSVITREGVDALKKVVINITLPAVVFSAFATMEYSLKNLLITVVMYLIAVLAVVLGKVLKALLKEDSPFLPYITTGFEAGMIGYALYIALYGSDTVSSFAVVDLGQSLFVFTCYKVLLTITQKDEKISPGKVAKDMVRTPIILGILSGIALGATGLYQAMVPLGVASVIDTCAGFVSAPTSAIILLTIGYDLVLKDVPWKRVIKANIARILVMIVMRIGVGFAARAIGLGNTLDAAFNIMFILPPPYVLPVFADNEEERGYISSTLSVSTIITMLAFAVFAILGI